MLANQHLESLASGKICSAVSMLRREHLAARNDKSRPCTDLEFLDRQIAEYGEAVDETIVIKESTRAAFPLFTNYPYFRSIFISSGNITCTIATATTPVSEQSTSQTIDRALYSSRALLKASKKCSFMKADELFNKEEVVAGMTIGKFKENRANAHVPIEDLILKERYE